MKGGATTMKTTSIARLALATLMVMIASTALAQTQSLTITMKDGTVHQYTAWDSIRYVGGEWQQSGGIGVKIYVNGNTTSDDFLYSQMSNFVLTNGQSTTVAAPVIMPNGGSFTNSVTVTITAESGATIYYTTDGSDPVHSGTTLSSTTTVTLTLTSTTTVRAIAFKDGVLSDEATATFTKTSTSDNNVNANWKEALCQTQATNATSSSATYNLAWRLEYPHISTDANSMVIVHATTQYGISLSLELNKSLRANRWSCFTMHNGVPNNNAGRGSWTSESLAPSSAQVESDEYTDGKYTTSTNNLDGSSTVLFSRGHICASEDRQSSRAQNDHTFITSNCHPQYQQHNGGLWQRIENKVQSWGYDNSFRDTLYVCKGATIADVTLDNTTVSGTIPYSEVKTKFGVTLTGTLTIPRYWYMAVLCLKNGSYHAMAFWSEQINSSCSSTTVRSCMITIDELERRTGIDFFCNLPDDVESSVESTLETSFWNVTN